MEKKMDWRFIKWLYKQPKLKIQHTKWPAWGGLFDSIEIFVNKKLMYTIYKHPEKNDNFRCNWIERL